MDNSRLQGTVKTGGKSMDKQQFIQNDLAIKVAELTLANAQLRAELQEKEQLLAELENPEGGTADGNKDI